MVSLKNSIRVLGLVFFASLFLGMPAFSQEDDCAVKLKEAQASFDRGQVEQVSGLINPCLQSGRFSREDEITAYKLVIQALLLDEKTPEAEVFMLRFLKKNPEYEHTAADYTGFVYMKSKFEVNPLLMLSFQAGLNFMFFTDHAERSVSSMPGDISISREPLNINTGAELIYPISPRFKVAGGLFYSSSSYTYTENILNFSKVEYRESLSRIEIPLSAIYDYKSFGKVTLYGRLGGGYVMNLKTDAKALNTPTDINNGFNRTGENVDRSSSRIRSDFFVQAGLGGMFKVPKGYFTTEIKTSLGMRNQVIGSLPGNLEYFYFYTDDTFKMNMIGISFGYTRIFYKPSKIQDL